ncbi:type III-A CRISPR-associated protein Cas10/Csm1 [Iningainema tapete]|uniref:CRISPR system single-strand-specific deoxyribonuclease Cas10/Csm1 (subtype III-A) n=1 Tax=Iningainema tapete BLCC-T55 TaxID=2748662 RepID=A0A8J6XQW9_9CYAN|nr:type III-A CRISPR-associated protein Cas10/Csm1 [Iningainema tapete]MBD2777897.1 type III-A CRISPR-associated protein Cas10/Csm1 [Iningainema tapete BLCC-T55]
MSNPTPASDAALRVSQQAVTLLTKWAAPDLANKCPPLNEEALWLNDFHPKPLKLLFSSVWLYSHTDMIGHYWKPKSILDREPIIPYPQAQKPAPEDFNSLKQEIRSAIESLHKDDWQNLSLLTLILEKFGSFISVDEADVALVDIVKTTAAIAAATNHTPTTELSLIAGDLSGIQKFIYTISSDGALKSLRARSFYLELVTEEVVQQLLTALQLPRTNVIYAGGGNLYILAGAENTKEIVEQVRQQFNEWLLDEFQGKVFLALDCLPFPLADATEAFAQHWSNVTQKLANQKSRKFAEQITSTQFIKQRHSYEPCRVCHRDDEELEKLNSKEPDSVLACKTCRSMFELGGQLLQVEAIVRSPRQFIPGALHTLPFKLPTTNIYYHLFRNWKQIDTEADTVLLVNDWTLEHYKFRHFPQAVPLLLGNYGKPTKEPEENSFMRANEMAQQAQGIKRVGYLRMDVDRLGQIFAKGLREKQTLPRLAGLSRQMSYFFKVYLKSVAENPGENLPQNLVGDCPRGSAGGNRTSTQESRNLLFIYAGGDDLFVSGAWNEVVEFAFDVYQCFRAYTGDNPDITLSGGISIADAKYPLYQAAQESGEAEDAAKGNGRDSLSLFGQVFKWDEWLGTATTSCEHHHLKEKMPKLLGVLPFVKRLEKQNIGINYARSFVRNLLITAQIQEQALKKFADKKTPEALDTRYYLHLPKIAYTLARLPNKVRNDSDFRTSLKSPYNAPYFRAIATWIEILNREV